MKIHPEKFNLTKIVATVGPASSETEVLEKMIEEGCRVFRINFSHGSFEEHSAVVGNIRKAIERSGIPIAILGDLPGPKIRIGEVIEGGLKLEKDQLVEFVPKAVVSGKEYGPVKFSTNYPDFLEEVESGQPILIDDGNIRMICNKKIVTGSDIRIEARVTEGGLVSSHKGVNLPKTRLSLPSLTEKDRKVVKFAVDNKFDYLALSFVRSARDILELKDLLRKLGARPTEPAYKSGEGHDLSILEGTYEGFIPIISKIEKPQAIDDLEEILKVTDAVMVARGDLGVEMELAEVAVLQKKIMVQCRKFGVPAIVATQMLQSMVNSPVPTRAEVSDVANAIFDGADAVMLSGETAVGSYPVEAVRAMNRIACLTNDYIRESRLRFPDPVKVAEMKYRSAALAGGVKSITEDMDVKVIGVWSELGGSAVFLSQYRIPQTVIAFSSDHRTLRILSLLYGIMPIYMEKPESSNDFIRKAEELILDMGWAVEGDTAVYVFREPIDKPGLTNQMSIHFIGDEV